MGLQQYSIIVRKDNSGFYQKPLIGSHSMMFLGVSPQNSDLAVVAHTSQDVVGMHKDVPIYKLPYSTITLEPMDSLVEAPYEVLVELGIVKKTDA